MSKLKRDFDRLSNLPASSSSTVLRTKETSDILLYLMTYFSSTLYDLKGMSKCVMTSEIIIKCIRQPCH